MSRKLISFDWAIKRLLRSKANYEVLEGFLSELLKDDVSIIEVLESESNQDAQQDKFNRVDLKVRNSHQEIIIVEIQYDRELDYFQRILYAASKAVIEHQHKGEAYQNIVKVISINILYFNLGEGDDYIYKGTTRFRGLHEQDELQLTRGQKKLFSKEKPHDLFPEYYLIRVNKFNDIAKDSLDEWVYFLKNEEIKEGFKARGLKKAKAILDVMKLSEPERLAYERYMENKSYQASMYQSTYVSGQLKGREEGLIEMAIVMKKEGESIEKIMKFTQLSKQKIESL